MLDRITPYLWLFESFAIYPKNLIGTGVEISVINILFGFGFYLTGEEQ